MKGKHTEEKAWRQTYLVDKKQLDSLAKDVPKLFPFSMTVNSYADKISKMIAESDQGQLKINKEQTATFQKLADIAGDVESLRNTLKFYEQTNEYLVKVQTASECIIEKLQQFRGKMGIAYQQLAEAQETLDDELQMLGKKIEGMQRGEDVFDQKQNLKNNNKEVKGWMKKEISEKRDERTTENQKASQLQLRMKDKEREVDALQKMICSLGKNLGWPEQDHKDFISIWHRGSNNKKYFQIQEELQAYFSFYTAEQIQQHMNKYLKFRKCNDQKKQLVTEYKNLKEVKKMQELKALNLQRQKSQEQKIINQQKIKLEKDQAEMKMKLVQWKEIKAKQKKEEEEQKAKLQWERKQEEAAKRREAEEKNRERLEKWKQEEAQKKQELRRIHSARKPVAIDQQAGQRIRLREELLIQKKLELVNERKREQEMQKIKEERVREQKFVKFSHVNGKLQHKTTAMREKERQKFDGKQKKQANTFGGQLLMTGVRATPAWMKGA